MSLESIEKELKSIKLLIILVSASVLFFWTDGLSTKILMFGVLLILYSSAPLSTRLHSPRFQKFCAYAGIAFFWIGFAIFVVDSATSLVSIIV